NEARIALGGVATVPWRAREAESFLIRRRLTPDVAERAAEVAFTNANPLKHNGFKIALGRRTLERTLLETAGIETGHDGSRLHPPEGYRPADSSLRRGVESHWRGPLSL